MVFFSTLNQTNSESKCPVPRKAILNNQKHTSKGKTLESRNQQTTEGIYNIGYPRQSGYG